MCLDYKLSKEESEQIINGQKNEKIKSYARIIKDFIERKDDEYTTVITCGNCYNKYLVAIKKGTRISQVKLPCPNCGCCRYGRG